MSALNAPGSQGPVDVGSLYREAAERLQQIVRRDVRAPEAVIEDACQVAWGRLVHHADRVASEAALSWLARTAVHEALKLLRRESRELSLEGSAEWIGEPLGVGGAAGPHEIVELRDRIDSIGALPVRQQRLVWLHGLGLSYGEIAAYTGCTVRTVERQLLRAKRTLRWAR